jgi:hypothetical protein
MNQFKDMQVEFVSDNNQTIIGYLTFSNINRPAANATVFKSATERDAEGASTYIVSVILVYAIAIVFLIASHVFVKKKEDTLEYQLSIVNKYWKQAHKIKEKGARESFKKLKFSIVPAVAKSAARDLISRRKSYAPFLVAGAINDLGKRNSMPAIDEEANEETADEYMVLPGVTVASQSRDEENSQSSSSANTENYLVPEVIETQPHFEKQGILKSPRPSVSHHGSLMSFTPKTTRFSFDSDVEIRKESKFNNDVVKLGIPGSEQTFYLLNEKCLNADVVKPRVHTSPKYSPSSSLLHLEDEPTQNIGLDDFKCIVRPLSSAKSEYQQNNTDLQNGDTNCDVSADDVVSFDLDPYLEEQLLATSAYSSNQKSKNVIHITM